MGLGRLFTKFFGGARDEPVVFDNVEAVRRAQKLTEEWSDTCGAPVSLAFEAKRTPKTILVLIKGVSEMELEQLFETLDAKCASVESVTLDFTNKAIEVAFSIPTAKDAIENDEPAKIANPRPPIVVSDTSVPLIGKKRKAEDEQDLKPECVVSFL